MRKGIAALILLWIFSFCVPLASAKTIYVDGALPNDCTNSGYSAANRDCSGSDGDAYRTIASAVGVLSSGDILFIRSGTYNENAATIPDHLDNFQSMTTISGYGSERPLIHGDSPYYPTFDLSGSGNLTFKNLDFTGTQFIYSNTVTWTYSGSNDIWYRLPPFECISFQKQISGTWTEMTNRVNLSNLIANGIDGDYTPVYSGGWNLYIKSTSNPSTRIDLREGGSMDPLTLGSSSREFGYTVVDNCSFDTVKHAHLKGKATWMIKNSRFKNCGFDFHDHCLYLSSPDGQSQGNETIIEYNYFDIETSTIGAAIQLYPMTKYSIIRYNVIRSKIDTGQYGRPFWCIALWGRNSYIIGNTCYGSYKCIEIGESPPDNNDNVVENNICYQYTSVGVAYGSGMIQNLTMRNNLIYSSLPSALTPYYAAGPGSTVSGNIVSMAPSFVQVNPADWYDFRLASNSPTIDAGINVGSPYNLAFDPSGTSWPPSRVDQNIYGSGWEMGAFVYMPMNSSCIHEAEITPCNGCVDNTELTAFIDRWKIDSQDVTLKELIEAIGLWKRGC